MIDQAKIHTYDSTEERFIPIALNDLAAHLVVDLDLDDEDQLLFKRFCKIYVALYHAKFFAKLQNLKENYLPFSPDRTTLPLQRYSNADLMGMQKNLIGDIKEIIGKANYNPISQEELNRALAETSPYGLDVSVNFDDFDEIHLYYRGLSATTEQRRSWRTLYLQPESIDIPIYQRLFLVLKLKPAITSPPGASFFADPKNYLLEKWHHLFQMQLAKGGDSSLIYLKLFKDIPKSDLEMLFPNTRVEMQRFDKVTMGVSSGGGIIGGILAAVSKIARAAHPAAIMLAAAGFMGIIWREAGKMLSNRNRYLATLAKSLYFHNLDNNLGVLANLIEMAEEEECKEAILAYGFLLTQQAGECSQQTLDQEVERYLRESYGVQVNFELGDGIRKLREADLLIETANKLIKPSPLASALTRLDREWDDMFTFGDSSAEESSPTV